ncbi:hypothetical protein MTO96_002094 [Rhipicephalus appendiculatus]
MTDNHDTGDKRKPALLRQLAARFGLDRCTSRSNCGAHISRRAVIARTPVDRRSGRGQATRCGASIVRAPALLVRASAAAAAAPLAGCSRRRRYLVVVVVVERRRW